MRARLLLVLIAALTAWSSAVRAQPSLPMPDLARPAAGESVIDPATGARLTRLTDARATGYEGIVPQYSRRQAWNADESLLLLRAGDGMALLYDGISGAFLRALPGVDGDDVIWHPLDPAVIYYNPGNSLRAFNIAGGDDRLVADFSAWTFADTRGEGDVSRDGRYYAFAGRSYDEDSGEVSYDDLVVFDLAEGRAIAGLALPPLDDFDWVSISPLGNYVVVDYADTVSRRFHGVEVYRRDFTFLWQRGLGPGHSDLGLDENGDEVLVIGVYDPDTNRSGIRAVRLADGRETALVDFYWAFESHVSCRAEGRPGWCLISTYDGPGRLTDSGMDWQPLEDEVFWVKLDGSGTVERLAHHRSRRFGPGAEDSDRSNYFAEPHATSSRRGDRVLFGSNWRQEIRDPAAVDTYLAVR